MNEVRGPSTRGVEVYSRQTLYATILLLVLASVLVATPTQNAMVVLVTAGLTTVLAGLCVGILEYFLSWMRREPSARLSTRNRPRRAVTAGSVVALVVAGVLAWWLITRVDQDQAALFASASFGLVVACWTPMLSLRQASLSALAATLVAIGAVLVWAPDLHPILLILVPLLVGALVFTFAATCWVLRVTIELDHAREVNARLAVAQERLRMSRDLHDVVGRTLAAVSLKTQLAAGLTERGRQAEALAELAAVRELADEAATQVRSVAHGYRDLDLQQEIIGARELLSASGVACRVVIDPALRESSGDLQEFASLGWVVREAVTNLLRHSDARRCEIAIRPHDEPDETGRLHAGAQVRISNDRPRAAGRGSGSGSGLRGLSERLDEVGGVLRTSAGEDEFVVTAWAPSSPGDRLRSAPGSVGPTADAIESLKASNP
ncbi:MAG: sensor histidine kinase [Actinomycetales bacterium]